MRLSGRQRTKDRDRKLRSGLFSPDPSLRPPQELYVGQPAGIRGFLLNEYALKLHSRQKGNPFPYQSYADRLWRRMFAKSKEASALERQGNVDGAIALYEEVVADMFEGSQPYERLRILYGQRQAYDKAIRACRRYIEMADTLIRLGSSNREALEAGKARFAAWIPELQKRLEQAGPL
jgi:hypothetical protein